MSTNIILDVTCQLRPKYVPYVKHFRYFEVNNEIMEHNSKQHLFMRLLDIWNNLNIGNHFETYDVDENGIFTFKIDKNYFEHDGHLEDDYKCFMRDIIVPMTSKISSCTITDIMIDIEKSNDTVTTFFEN